MSVSTFEEITKTKPEKSLVVKLKKHSGRNNQGRITTRHRGGGAKRAYRLIDFKRNKQNVPAKVAAIEYDPNRSARIALLHYVDGEKRYILAPVGLKVGDRIDRFQGKSVTSVAALHKLAAKLAPREKARFPGTIFATSSLGSSERNVSLAANSAQPRDGRGAAASLRPRVPFAIHIEGCDAG